MIEYTVYPDYFTLSNEAAKRVIRQVRHSKSSVLGLATGSTPIGLYARLIDQYRRGKFSLANVTTFNLDEYVGIPNDHAQSYHVFMENHLFNHVDIPAAQRHFPGVHNSDVQYDQMIAQAGGMDLQILGIGTNGHIGFNEPGSSFESRTREVELAESTIQDNARFFDDPGDVPRRASTMGISTILKARHILLLASGVSKAAAVAAALRNKPSVDVPASCLQLHHSVHVMLDPAAAVKLSYPTKPIVS